MSLLDRLIGTNLEEKLPVHAFTAVLSEYKRGAVTGTQVGELLELSAEEKTQLQGFLGKLDSDTINRSLLHDVLMLGESGLYDKNDVKNRLGL